MSSTPFWCSGVEKVCCQSPSCSRSHSINSSLQTERFQKSTTVGLELLHSLRMIVHCAALAIRPNRHVYNSSQMTGKLPVTAHIFQKMCANTRTSIVSSVPVRNSVILEVMHKSLGQRTHPMECTGIYWQYQRPRSIIRVLILILNSFQQKI